MSPDQFYEEGRSRGMFHGSAFQGIKNVDIGNREVLAQLQLPENVSGTSEQFVLHPCIMDSALQTATICIMQELTDQKLILPFALEQLEVIKGCSSSMWAYARLSDRHHSGDIVQKRISMSLTRAETYVSGSKGSRREYWKGRFLHQNLHHGMNA